MPALFTIRGDVRYEVVRKIADGGMAIVYEAEQRGARDFMKRVAIKVIRQNYAGNPEFIANFIGEAKLVADLVHTNIVQTYQLGEFNGVYYMAMEYIDGINLDQLTTRLSERRKRLPAELGIFIASRICRGLAYAHGKCGKDAIPLGIVHRDVSPKNVMIAWEGDVKLTDFGVAKAAGFLIDHEGEVVAGKADYMSPEQADFRVTDKRSDLFSVGVLLAWLLLGRNIFKATTPEASRERIVSMEIPDFRKLDKRIDKGLNTILQRALARSLSERYPAADEMLYDLEYHIYKAGYGPTNEKLGKFVRELFGSRPGRDGRKAPAAPKPSGKFTLPVYS
jgi:eukaryotic-like serine/threonine-protein kinase